MVAGFGGCRSASSLDQVLSYPEMNSTACAVVVYVECGLRSMVAGQGVVVVDEVSKLSFTSQKVHAFRRQKMTILGLHLNFWHSMYAILTRRLPTSDEYRPGTIRTTYILKNFGYIRLRQGMQISKTLPFRTYSNNPIRCPSGYGAAFRSWHLSRNPQWRCLVGSNPTLGKIMDAQNPIIRLRHADPLGLQSTTRV